MLLIKALRFAKNPAIPILNYTRTTLNTRKMFSTHNEWHSQVNVALQMLKDGSGVPITQSKLISTVQIEGTDVVIKLHLTKDFRKAKTLITDHLQKSLPWATKITVSMAPQPVQTNDQKSSRMQGLADVKNIIAVSSCKGGVGKSTVAVNLAFTLMKQGFEVGIFDADLYGPSLPTMISPESTHLYTDEQDQNKIKPIMFSGVKTMSYGFATQNKTAVMRGPMASNLVAQLVGQTKWEALDYLVVDFPPGTGDIQLTLGQELRLTAAVIVTTPQKLAYVDVVKGIEMFDQLKVPTIAVVENMAYYVCSSCDTKHRLFGDGYTKQLKDQFGIKNSFEVPILEEVSQMSDSGTPFVLSLPEEVSVVQVYNQLALKVDEEIKRLRENQTDFQVKYDPLLMRVVVEEGVEDKKVVKVISPYELRIKCKCAGCIDEVDGRQILQINKVPKDVYPTNMVRKGNYAVAVVWSDGHRSSIYPIERLLSNEINSA